MLSNLKVNVSYLIMILALCGCASAWKKHPIPTQPDYSCSTTGAAGYDYYIWDCLNNEHVVVYQFFGEFFVTSAAEIEKVKCGELTAFEQNIKVREQGRNTCKRPAQPWQP